MASSELNVSKCPLCSLFDDPGPYQSWFRAQRAEDGAFAITCPRCGKFSISEELLEDIRDNSRELLSANLALRLSAASRRATDARRLIKITRDSISGLVRPFS